MPILSISTNLPKHKVPSTFLDDASKLVSQILKIPELVSQIYKKINFFHNGLYELILI